MGVSIELERLRRRRAIVDQLTSLIEEYARMAASPSSPLSSPGAWDAPYGPGASLVSAEPVVAEGFRCLLSASPLRLTATYSDPTEAIQRIDPASADLLIFHPGSAAFLDWSNLCASGCLDPPSCFG